MSRSYKKNPFLTDCGQGRSYAKRTANKIFRRKIAEEEDMSSYPKFKKYSCSWNICDYRMRMTEEEAIEWYEYRASKKLKKRFPTLELWLKYWAKCYIRK